MGLRHLQTFMQQYVPQGFTDVNIDYACKQYISKHLQKPILIIDLMGLLNSVTKDYASMICGGRHHKYKEDIEILLRNLSEVADLVFFEGKLIKHHFKSTSNAVKLTSNPSNFRWAGDESKNGNLDWSSEQKI